MFRSFVLRIFLFNFVLLILPVPVYFIFLTHFEHGQANQSAYFQLHDSCSFASQLLGQIVSRQYETLGFLKANLFENPKPPTNDEMQTRFRLLASHADILFLGLYYYQPGGTFRGGIFTDNQLATKYIRIIQEGSTRGKAAYVASLEDEPIMIATDSVILPGQKDPLGLLTIATRIPAFLHALNQIKELFPELKTYLEIGNGTLVPLDTGEGAALSSIVNPKPIVQGSNIYTWQRDGSTEVGAKLPVPGTPFYLLMSESKLALAIAFYKSFLHLALIFVAIIIVMGFLNLWFIKKLSRPMLNLMEVMQKVGQGEQEVRYKSAEWGFEINRVGEALNSMIEAMLGSMEQAEKERLHHEVLTKELRIGREIQQSLLPQEMAHLADVDVAGRSIPAFDVGGDFYDVYVKDDSIALIIADTAGRGILSCLYALGVRSMLRSYGMLTRDQREILAKTNDLFCQDTGQTGTFVSVATAAYYPKTRQLDYSSAGHAPSIWIKTDGSSEELNTAGVVLGAEMKQKFDSKVVHLNAGDLICMYTDGLTEGVKNANGEIFGKERLIGLLVANRTLASESIIERVVQEISQFSGGQKNEEDVTFIILKATAHSS